MLQRVIKVERGRFVQKVLLHLVVHLLVLMVMVIFFDYDPSSGLVLKVKSGYLLFVACHIIAI